MASRDALNLLKQRQIAATSSRQAAEVRAATATAGNVQGRVIGTEQGGTTVRTSNGGDILVDNIGGRTPADGSVVQLSTSTAGGKAELNTQERSQETTEASAGLRPVREVFRAPTPNDVGQEGEIWIHQKGKVSGGYDQVSTYFWSTVQGRFVGRNHSELGGFLPASTQGQEIPIRPRMSFDAVLASIYVKEGAAAGQNITTVGSNSATSGSTIIQLNYSIGDSLLTGDRLTLTPVATGSSNFEYTIGFIV